MAKYFIIGLITILFTSCGPKTSLHYTNNSILNITPKETTDGYYIGEVTIKKNDYIEKMKNSKLTRYPVTRIHVTKGFMNFEVLYFNRDDRLQRDLANMINLGDKISFKYNEVKQIEKLVIHKKDIEDNILLELQTIDEKSYYWVYSRFKDIFNDKKSMISFENKPILKRSL